MLPVGSVQRCNVCGNLKVLFFGNPDQNDTMNKMEDIKKLYIYMYNFILYNPV